MIDADVAIIGAGPHGLAAAVHLKRAGVDARVFGEPMSFWRSMPKGMKLRSNLRATNLIEPAGPYSLKAFTADTGIEVEHPVPLAQFIDYGLWVQRTALVDVDERRVRGVERGVSPSSRTFHRASRSFRRRLSRILETIQTWRPSRAGESPWLEAVRALSNVQR
jgi:hypothetical protein